MGVLDELQNAYNAIAGIDDSLLNPREKFKIYLKMDYAYRILEEIKERENYIDHVKELRERCRKKYLEEVGKKQFKREIHTILDNLIVQISKKSKMWKYARTSIYMVSIGYVLPSIGAIPLIIPAHMDLLPMLIGFAIGVWIVAWSVLSYPSKNSLTILFMLGPFAIYTDFALMTLKWHPLFALTIVSIALICVALYFLLKNRFIFY